MRDVPITRPTVRFEDVQGDLRAILDSGRLTSGPYLERFEVSVARYVGVAHAVATTSATTALHLVLAAAGIGPGDEVLVADFTFPATGNVIAQLGATPVLVDSSPSAFSLDPLAAAALVTDRTRAVVPVDPFGQPADMASIADLAERHSLLVVEDAACALGASRASRACGSWPAAGCFSFHPRKVITTGEGGMVTTDDGALAERLRRLRSHGGKWSDGVGLSFVEHGFNYRLSELQCAIGVSQLARIDQILGDRARIAGAYRERLASFEHVLCPQPSAGELWTYQSFVVVLADEVDRDGVIRAMARGGIETTLGTYAMHAQPAFSSLGYAPGDLPVSWRLQRQTLTLPLVPEMTDSDVDRVVETLGRAIRDCL